MKTNIQEMQPHLHTIRAKFVCDLVTWLSNTITERPLGERSHILTYLSIVPVRLPIDALDN